MGRSQACTIRSFVYFRRGNLGSLPSVSSVARSEMSCVCIAGYGLLFPYFLADSSGKISNKQFLFSGFWWLNEGLCKQKGGTNLLAGETHLPGVTQFWGLWSSVVPGPPCLFLLPASSQTCACVRAFSGVTHVLQRKCLRCFLGEQTCYSCPKR